MKDVANHEFGANRDVFLFSEEKGLLISNGNYRIRSTVT